MNRCLVAFVLFYHGATFATEQVCTYQTYSWNTITKQAVDHATINKPYSDLTADEIDRYTGCSVCEQDQRSIHIAPLKPFKLCRIISSQITTLLRQFINQNESITEIIGYRVGKTRGEVDKNGIRTRFSNHSFGIALDINPQQNGLYETCVEFGDSCRLIRGGEWRPDRHGSLTADGNIVTSFEGIGMKWGGEIEGKQKDFMHFSPTGY